MSEYIEHRSLHLDALHVADSTLASGERKVWLGTPDGIRGRWLTHAEFRQHVAALAVFADTTEPSEDEAQGIIDSLGAHHAAIQRLDEMGYRWSPADAAWLPSAAIASTGEKQG